MLLGMLHTIHYSYYSTLKLLIRAMFSGFFSNLLIIFIFLRFFLILHLHLSGIIININMALTELLYFIIRLSKVSKHWHTTNDRRYNTIS